MKADNILTSVMNAVNPPAFTSVNESAAIAQKRTNAAVLEKNVDLGQVSTEKLDMKMLGRTIDVANNAFKDVNVGFKIEVNEKINRTVVQVLNTETGEVIKQFPPEEIVNMLERMYDMLGILIDKQI